MSDDQLTHVWRRTERFAEASMVLAVLLAVLGCPIVYDWPDWALFVFILPLWVASIVAHFGCLWVLRPWMDRRGLDWEAPVWWVQ